VNRKVLFLTRKVKCLYLFSIEPPSTKEIHPPTNTHQSWTLIDWRNVIFSDESKINLFGSDGMTYVRRKVEKRFKNKCLKRIVRQGRSRVVWGCFSYYGVGDLALIDGTVNGEKYKIILDQHLIPSIEEHFSYTKDLIFQDDSAPCHRAKTVSHIFIFIP